MINLVAAAFIAASAFTLAPLAFADGKHGAKGHGGHAGHGGAAQASTAHAGDMAEGEVRRVDKDAKKITIRHGPLAKFDMPAMTMVFQVKDPAMLDKVKAGDKVKFDAEKVGGAFMLTALEHAH
jgi:Cu(I)/Ag(I) efflux system periplasmic protein CusF